MKHLTGFGLAFAATASLGLAEGGPGGPDSNAPLAADAKVTFTPGKGITIDGGEDYMVNVVHRVQVKWRYVDLENGSDTNGFRVRRVRQKWTGHVFNEDTTYKVQFDFAESEVLKDIWVRYRFMNGDDSDISIRMGQMKTHGGRESDASSGNLEFAERSIASRTFADARATGAMVEGYHLEDEKLFWYAGAWNTDSAAMSSAANEQGTNNGENRLNYGLGIGFDPSGRMYKPESGSQGDLNHDGEFKSSLGANLHFINEFMGTTKVESRAYNLNAAIRTGSGIAAEGEFFARTDDPEGGSDADANGWHVQGSYTLAPEDGRTQWGFAVRAAMVDFDDAPVMLMGAAPLEGSSMPTALSGPGDVFEINAAVNAFYHKHMLKTQVVYTYQKASPDVGSEETNHALEVMVTALF